MSMFLRGFHYEAFEILRDMGGKTGYINHQCNMLSFGSCVVHEELVEEESMRVQQTLFTHRYFKILTLFLRICILRSR